MKIHLLILSTLINLVLQQKIAWPISYAARLHLLPIYVDHSNPDPSPSHPQNTAVPIISLDDPNPSDADGLDAYHYQILGRNKAQSKFGVFSNGFFFSNLLPLTVTSTSYSVVSSTLTTTVVSPCIPSTQFVTANGVTSTALCARRKRSLPPLDHLNPSSPSPELQTSAIPTTRDANVELQSSKEDAVDAHSQSVNGGVYRGRADPTIRRNRAVTLISTVTSTITSYAFVSTVVSRTVSVASSNALLCRPTGYVVC